jgi:hypothetical protein
VGKSGRTVKQRYVEDELPKGAQARSPSEWYKSASQRWRNAQGGNADAANYRKRYAPWAEAGEVYLTKKDSGVDRHFDVANRTLQRAVEVKSMQGNPKRKILSLNNDINRELKADKILVAQGWNITWVIRGYDGISKGLRDALKNAGVKFRIV